MIKNLVESIRYKRDRDTIPVQIFRDILGNEELSLYYFDKAYELWIKTIMIQDDSIDNHEIEGDDPQERQSIIGQLWKERADIHKLFRKLGTALQYYNKGEEYGYRDCEIYKNLGETYEEFSNFRKALESYRKYLEKSKLKEMEFYIYGKEWFCRQELAKEFSAGCDVTLNKVSAQMPAFKPETIQEITRASQPISKDGETDKLMMEFIAIGVGFFLMILLGLIFLGSQ